MKSICVTCNIEFPTLEELETHEKAGHPAPTIPTTSITPAPAMNPQFEQTLKDIAAEEKRKKEEQLKQLQSAHEQKAQQSTVKKPLELVYKYIGNCKCGSDPLTIITDTPAGMYAVAFCLSENQQIESIAVQKITQPKKIEIKLKEPISEAQIVEEPKNDIIKPKKKNEI